MAIPFCFFLLLFLFCLYLLLCGETFKIFRLFGNGFHAWTTFPYCEHTTSSYTDDCFANIEYQNVENVTKKIFPTFVPFTPTKFITTTTTTTTKKPITSVAATLTPLNQFKYSTFAPFSLFTPTPPTVKYPTVTAQFVNYYTTSTTKRPSFGSLAQFTTTTTTPKPTSASTKFTFASIPSFALKTSSSSYPSIGTKTTDSHTFAVVRNNFITTTTPRPAFPSIQTASLFATTPRTILAPVQSIATTKLNLFDLYLGRLTTKAPQFYNFPSLLPPKKQAITYGNPYAIQSSTTTASPFLNSYSFSDYFKTKSTTAKPTTQQIQSLFQTQATKFARSLGIQNTTLYLQPTASDTTTRKPRVWRYSFSGTTKTSA